MPTPNHHTRLPDSNDQMTLSGKLLSPSRRSLFAGVMALSGASVLSGEFALNRIQAAESDRPQSSSWDRLKFCLNTSTINHSQVPVRQQIKIAAEAGYDGVELWLGDIESFTKSGGSLTDLRKEMSDLGLELFSAIAFGRWIVDDDQKRAAGLERCRRDMQIVADLGGRYIAAPPSGATGKPRLDLNKAAERYRELLNVGKLVGVVPQLELWGFSYNLSTLAELLYVAAGAQHVDAAILLDIYHLYKGGCDFQNPGMIPFQQMPCLHMNDYPAEPGRAEIGDADRVYPGDGVAPISEFLRAAVAGGFAGVLSLELFNREYWKQPAFEVACTGLQKMRDCVARARN